MLLLAKKFARDIPALIGGRMAWVGFTGGTGLYTATREILNWTFTPAADTPEQAGTIKATAGALSGAARARVVRPLPWTETFESMAEGSVPPGWINGTAGKFSVVTLDGPHTRNALDAVAAGDLIAACAEIDSNPAVGALIITGAGRAFCAGGVQSDGGYRSAGAGENGRFRPHQDLHGCRSVPAGAAGAQE